jgi:hypothetical protein
MIFTASWHTKTSTTRSRYAKLNADKRTKAKNPAHMLGFKRTLTNTRHRNQRRGMVIDWAAVQRKQHQGLVGAVGREQAAKVRLLFYCFLQDPAQIEEPLAFSRTAYAAITLPDALQKPRLPSSPNCRAKPPSEAVGVPSLFRERHLPRVQPYEMRGSDPHFAVHASMCRLHSYLFLRWSRSPTHPNARRQGTATCKCRCLETYSSSA